MLIPKRILSQLAIEHDPHRAGPQIHLDPPAGTRVWLAQTCRSTGGSVFFFEFCFEMVVHQFEAGFTPIDDNMYRYV